MDQQLVSAGVTQIAIGAVSGWPLALLVARPGLAEKLGIEEPVRLRQAHIDVLIMGGLITAAGHINDAPNWAKVSARIGAWTNPLLFVPLAFNPKSAKSVMYQLASVVSFSLTTAGWVGLANAARKQRKQQSLEPNQRY